MKSITKFLLAGAVAVAVIAISAAPSEAAKKKAKAAAPCMAGMLCTSAETSHGWSKVMICGGDGKWYQALFTPWCVTGGICPPACR